MTERPRFEGPESGVVSHCAVSAWSRLSSRNRLPSRVVALGRPRGKSAVYRLEDAVTAGAVVAKRTSCSVGRGERTLYESVLPVLPISTLQLFGYVEDEDSDTAWLFLEDAGEERLSLDIGEHRTLAAQWLSLLHTSAWQRDFGITMNDRGPSYYFHHLNSARGALAEIRRRRMLNASLDALVQTLLERLDAVDSHWEEIRQYCTKMPRTLVHGDFVSKNMRIRPAPGGLILLPFDWEMAGCGIPAVDALGFAGDCEAYMRCTRNCWPEVNAVDIEQWTFVGKIFRYLASIDWKSSSCVSLDLLDDGAAEFLSLCESKMTSHLRQAAWVR